MTTPLNSRPFLISVGLGLAFIGLILYTPLLIIGAVLGIYGVYGWVKDDLRGTFSMPGEDVAGETWPFKPASESSFGQWRMRVGIWLFLASDVVFFSALTGAVLFVRINLPTWPAVGSVFDVPLATLGTIVLATSALTLILAVQDAKEGKITSMFRWLVATLVLGGAFLQISGFEWLAQFIKGFTFSSGLPGSTFYLLTGVTGAHVFTGLIMLVYLVKKSMNGEITKENHSSLQFFSLFWIFVTLMAVILFPLIYLM